METSKQKTSAGINRIINSLKNHNTCKNILSFDLGLISYNHAYNLQTK
ncbi:unnamed protein product, partial [marine sediment metagenome]